MIMMLKVLEKCLHFVTGFLNFFWSLSRLGLSQKRIVPILKQSHSTQWSSVLMIHCCPPNFHSFCLLPTS